MFKLTSKTTVILTVLLFLLSCTNNYKPTGEIVHRAEVHTGSINKEADTAYNSYLKFIQNDTVKCNINVLIPVSQNLPVGTLTDEQIYLFLRTFDKQCNRDAEYSEYSNELLFIVLEAYPERILTLLENTQEHIAIDYIIDELKSPVNDGIDVKKVYTIVTETKINTKIKERILSSLDTAKAKTP